MRPRIKNWINPVWFVLVAVCVGFEKQTMVYRHYPKADTLVIWQQYEVMDQYDPPAARADFFRAMDGLYKK